MTDTCTVADCEAPAAKRGWCNKHYMRWRKYGDTQVVKKTPPRPPTVFAGERYGRLTVLRQDGMNRGRDRAYLCQCDCGKTIRLSGYLLRSGNTKSCGCLRREVTAAKARTHGHTVINGKKSPTYQSWRGMISRCQPKAPAHEWYADRGIRVVEEWRGRTGFARFLEDMGERPEGMTLDRIDPDGNYEPGNCQWATMTTQSLNKRPRTRHSEVAKLKRIVAEQEAEIARLKRQMRGAGG